MNPLRPRLLLLLAALSVLSVPLALLTGCDEDDIERTIGHQSAASVEKEYGVNNDPVMQTWANTLGHRLVGQSHRQNIAYSFKVVNTDMVNAFAAPYGYCYLTQGFLDFTRSEDEVAFVLGHEIGHVANRDSIKSVKKSILFNIGAALVASKNKSLGNMGGLGAGLLLLHYSRNDERDADVCGSTYAYGAGYDPAGGVAFFERLQSEQERDQPSSIEHLFLSHPETPKRIAAQKQRPEMNLADPAVASRIGRTYSRRYAFATATSFYKQALDKKPEAVQTRVSLADAYAHQGLYDLAREQYQAILQHQPENTYAATGLQALAQAPPTYVAVQPAERQQAAAAVAVAGTAGEETSALVSASHTYTNSVAPVVKANSSLANRNISSLTDIAGVNKELSDHGNEVFVQGNAAISLANNCAFTLESVNKDLTRVSDLLRANAVALRVALARSADGQGQQGDPAVYRRSLQETRLGDKQLERAIATARESLPEVQKASRLANDTVGALDTMVNAKQPDRYLFPVRTYAADTTKQATAALAAVGKAKRMTMVAESRALLAKLNLAALGASPEIRQVYDGMIAYYCQSTPQQVADLRTQGMGLGDAAFVLMASHSTQAPPASYLGIINSNEVIEGLRNNGFNFQGPLPLLRFLSNAIDRETTARGA